MLVYSHEYLNSKNKSYLTNAILNYTGNFTRTFDNFFEDGEKLANASRDFLIEKYLKTINTLKNFDISKTEMELNKSYPHAEYLIIKKHKTKYDNLIKYKTNFELCFSYWLEVPEYKKYFIKDL